MYIYIYKYHYTVLTVLYSIHVSFNKYHDKKTAGE